MNDDELYAELVRRIGGRPVGEKPTAIEFSREREGTSTPLRLHVSPNSLGQHLREMQTDGELVFPEQDPLIGALQLLLVHIDEAVNVRGPGENDLVLAKGGVLAVDRSGEGRD